MLRSKPKTILESLPKKAREPWSAYLSKVRPIAEKYASRWCNEGDEWVIQCVAWILPSACNHQLVEPGECETIHSAFGVFLAMLRTCGMNALDVFRMKRGVMKVIKRCDEVCRPR